MEGICSKCHKSWDWCECENFHPPLTIPPLEVGRLMLDEEKGISPTGLIVSKQEATELYDYFLKRAGYISYETDEEVHKFINRLRNFLK